MNKEFITYEEALALKELGFDEPCFGYHNIDPYLKTPTFNLVKPFDHEWCLPAPLYQQAFRWFRNEYNYVHTIFPADLALHEKKKTDYACGLYLNDPVEIMHIKGRFNSYLEAQKICLRKLIEIVKENL